jgi:hypothetical protein
MRGPVSRHNELHRLPFVPVRRDIALLLNQAFDVRDAILKEILCIRSMAPTQRSTVWSVVWAPIRWLFSLVRKGGGADGNTLIVAF